MRRCSGELKLSDVLSDPLVRAVMAADGVDRRTLEASLDKLTSELRRRRSEARSPSID